MFATAKIGAIEFAGDEVRVAVVKTGRKMPQLLDLQARKALYEDPADRANALTRALNEALDALKTQPSSYVLCIPCMTTIVRALTIPFKGVARVSKAVPFELEPHLAFPLEELLLDFDVIREADGATEVLAVGVRRNTLEEQLAIVRGASVDPEMAGVDVIGMTALWQATQKNVKGLRAVMHVREENSVIAILHNKALAFFRILHFGAERLRNDPGMASREIQNTIRAFLAKWTGEETIDSLAITGITLEPEALLHLESALGMQATTMVMLERLKGALKFAGTDEESRSANHWEAAIGVAYTAGGGGLSINLMRNTQDVHAAVRGVIAHLMFSACLALVFLLGCAWYYHESMLRNKTTTEQIKEEIAFLENEIETLSAEGLGEDVDIRCFSDPCLLDILKEINTTMPPEKVTLSQIRVSQPGARGGWVEITGSTGNASDFNEVFSALKKSQLFKLADDTNIRLQGERTTFRVRAFRPEEEISEAQS